MKTLIILMLLCTPCFAQELKEKVHKLDNLTRFVDKKGVVYATQDVPLTSKYTLKKAVISETKILTEDEKDVVEYSLKENGRKLIHKEVRPLKNDYKNDFDRGTVSWTPKARNYSFHKIVIPDGTTVRDTNFSQKEPHTVAIDGKNLTFIDCNLVNVQVDPTWTLQGCNNAQIKRVKKSEEDLTDDKGAAVVGGKKIIISHQVEQKDGTFKEVAQDEEVTNDDDSYNSAILRLNK